MKTESIPITRCLLLKFIQGHWTASQWQYNQGPSLRIAVRKTWQLELPLNKLCKMTRDKHPPPKNPYSYIQNEPVLTTLNQMVKMTMLRLKEYFIAKELSKQLHFFLLLFFNVPFLVNFRYRLSVSSYKYFCTNLFNFHELLSFVF